MQRILNMVRKDLRRQLRSPMAMLFVLSFPVVFTTMLALAFGYLGMGLPQREQGMADDRHGQSQFAPGEPGLPVQGGCVGLEGRRSHQRR